jgi:hypothetical protein
MKLNLRHQTKREEFIKFILLLSVLVGYFAFLSWKYDLATGGIVSALTWSFFVLCTPIADAGFLIDLPVRLITGLRMVYSEIMVWCIAISLNLVSLRWAADSYELTALTSLLHKILITPWPYWSIILLCATGTFVSIRFGDEMIDVVSHKDRTLHHKHGFKHRLIVMAAFFLLVVWGYYHLLERLSVTPPAS